MAYIQAHGKRFRVRSRAADGELETITFDTEDQARRYLDLMTADRHRGLWIDESAGRITMNDWYQEWLPLQVHLRATTLERDDTYARSHILPAFGHLSINAITQPMVTRWVASLVASGYAPATVVKAYQVLGKILKAAKAARMIAFLPTDEVKLPQLQDRSMKIITEDEADVLHDSFPVARFKLFVTLGIYSGLRHGELAALRPSRVNFLRRRVTVKDTTVEVRGQPVSFNPAKTRAGRREVPIPQFVLDEISEHIDTYKVRADSLLFAGPKGGIWRKSNFRQRLWVPTVDDLGMTGFRVHDMRHTAISLWIDAGANVKEVAVWAGHRSVSTVIDRYGHLFPDGGINLTDKLDAKREERLQETLTGKRAARTAAQGRTSA